MEPHRIGLDRSVWQEPTAVLLLLLGGFILLVGWIVGAILLWTSNVWTTRDKLIGTLVVPFGAALPFAFVVLGPVGGGRPFCRDDWLRASCDAGSSGSLVPETIAFLVLAIAPFATSVYLWRRARAG